MTSHPPQPEPSGAGEAGEAARAADIVSMDKVVALCKRRGFIFPSSEIYGGVGSTYDFGHYGVLLKGNVKNEWWRAMLSERDDIVALDSAILQHPRVWEASGHLAGFTDPLVDCRTCGQRFRADHLEDLRCGRKPSKHPGEAEECDLTEARDFNLMFETTIGPVKESGATAYLRPETAQGIFINFKNVLQFSRKKPPFGIAQIGKSFRNEITPGNFIFRTREFEQMEMEYFVPPAEAQKCFEHWLAERMRWYTELGLRPDHLRLRAHDPDELSHYSSGTSDVEYLFPSTAPGGGARWSELEGIANRGDFDLTQHAKFSGEKLEYFDQATGERYVPHVIEPAAGADRATLAFMVDAYDEEVVGREGTGEGERRTVLRLHPRLAPVKVAVLPLVKKDGQPELAREVYRAVRGLVQAEYDDGGAIGKRYRRQDEIGTPFCVTVDHDSVTEGTVTVRDRDSLTQERLPIEGLAQELQRRVQAPWTTPKLAQGSRRAS
jgi:glycyl-tRNA synthetase